MDWYLKNESDDLISPRDQEELEVPCVEDICPSPMQCHWGFTGSEKFRSHNKYPDISTKPTVHGFDFNGQSPYAQISKAPSVREAEGTNPSAYEGPPSVDCCARTSEASFYGSSDFQLQNNMDWVDKMNSLLEEENWNVENPMESLSMPDSIYRSPSFEMNVLVDAKTLMMDMDKRETSMPTCSFTSLTNDISDTWRNVEDGSTSVLILEESKRSEGSPMTTPDPDQTLLVPPELSATNVREAVSDGHEPKCLEETVLQDLEDIMIQLSGKTRICFRDALYRLAKISKQQCAISQNRSANFDRPLFAEVNGECPSLGVGSAESETNVIDRTIANLMFNLQNLSPPDPPPPESLHRRNESFASSGPHYSSEQQMQPHHYQCQVNCGAVSAYHIV